MQPVIVILNWACVCDRAMEINLMYLINRQIKEIFWKQLEEKRVLFCALKNKLRWNSKKWQIQKVRKYSFLQPRIYKVSAIFPLETEYFSHSMNLGEGIVKEWQRFAACDPIFQGDPQCRSFFLAHQKVGSSLKLPSIGRYNQKLFPHKHRV